MEQPNRAFALVLRIVAVVTVLVAVALVLLPPDLLTREPRLLVWFGLVFGMGIGMGLWGLAWIVGRDAQAPPDVRSSLSRIEHHMIELGSRVHDLQLMSDRATRVVGVASEPSKDYSANFRQIASSLEQLRELSLLTDSDRRQRAHIDRDNRKKAQISELFALVASQQWPKAERMLISLQTDFPNDSDVAKGRSYLDHARMLVEDETMQRVTRQVDELIASASWERAWEMVSDLVEGFPSSNTARVLHERVESEFQIWCDTTTKRMLESIRNHIDNRDWRPALLEAEKLIEQFPAHPVAEGLRDQLHTLRTNAEIHERQELEVRIQQMMHDGQYSQAIELAEDVVHRFPNSPQAESLEVLLPKIRELSQKATATSEAAE